MDFNQLKHFLILSELLNFSKAAEKAFIGQSTLSKQIKQLETELAVTLFERDNRNVVLTPAGRYFKEEITEIIARLERTIERSRQLHMGEAGEIRIGYTHSAMQSLLPSLLSEIRLQFPNLKITLKEMTNTQQINAINSREIDISISPNPSIPPGLKSKILISGNFALVLPVNHRMNADDFNDISGLAQESFILPAKTEGVLYVSTIESIFTDAGFLPHVVHETSYANTGIRLVQAGIGITIEPIYGLSGYDDIKIIELTHISQKAELTMIWHPEFEVHFPGLTKLLIRKNKS